MAESKKVQTYTISIATNLDILIRTESLFTSYICGDSELPNIKIAKLSEGELNISGLQISEGDAFCVGLNIPTQNDIFIDLNGDLFITGTDSEKYSIDENGELIYEQCV